MPLRRPPEVNLVPANAWDGSTRLQTAWRECAQVAGHKGPPFLRRPSAACRYPLALNHATASWLASLAGRGVYPNARRALSLEKYIRFLAIRTPSTVAIGSRPFVNRARSAEHTSELQSLMRISSSFFTFK